MCRMKSLIYFQISTAAPLKFRNGQVISPHTFWACAYLSIFRLTHWGRVTHICVSKLTVNDSDNALSPGRRQAIVWTNAGILLIRTLWTNYGEILGKIHSFSFKKMHLKMSSAKGRLFSLGLNELRLSPVSWSVFYWEKLSKPTSNLGKGYVITSTVGCNYWSMPAF